MSGLRAEDVKEAIRSVAALVEHLKQYGGGDPGLPSVLAAARLWLASQATTEGRYVEPAGSSEQTPDIMISRNEDGEWPESVTSRIHLYDARLPPPTHRGGAMRLSGTDGGKVHVLGETVDGEWRTICGRPDSGAWAWEVADDAPRSQMPEPLCRRCEKKAFPVQSPEVPT